MQHFGSNSAFKSKQYPLYHVGCGKYGYLHASCWGGRCLCDSGRSGNRYYCIKNKKQHQPDAVQQPVVKQEVKQQTPAASNPDDSGYRVQCTSGALAGQRFMIRKIHR